MSSPGIKTAYVIKSNLSTKAVDEIGMTVFVLSLQLFYFSKHNVLFILFLTRQPKGGKKDISTSL